MLRSGRRIREPLQVGNARLSRFWQAHRRSLRGPLQEVVQVASVLTIRLSSGERRAGRGSTGSGPAERDCQDAHQQYYRRLGRLPLTRASRELWAPLDCSMQAERA
jgi:hypothetical protein